MAWFSKEKKMEATLYGYLVYPDAALGAIVLRKRWLMSKKQLGFTFDVEVVIALALNFESKTQVARSLLTML